MMPTIPAQALYEACVRGDAAAVSRLLPAGGTPLNLSGPDFHSDADKDTPLMVASIQGHTDIVRMILERAPNTAVDYMDTIGNTALPPPPRRADLWRGVALLRGGEDHLEARRRHESMDGVFSECACGWR